MVPFGHLTVQSATTLITAAALLWHTLAGCCAPGSADSCGCQHEHDATTHVFDEHLHSHTCPHDHDEPVVTDTEPVDEQTPTHPCRCHCDGNRCVAVASPAGWQIDAPQLAFDLVAFVGSAGEPAVETSSLPDGSHQTSIALALPVRAHLFYQILLI
jgi:hypothetical protein